MIMGLVLGIALCGLYFYDTAVINFLSDGKLVTQIPSLKWTKSYSLEQLKEVYVLDEDMAFSHLILQFPNEKKVTLYFIDNPKVALRAIQEAKKYAPKEEPKSYTQAA
jgi:hypothetical protein